MVREYIGARYVPKFMGPYDPTQSYEALCVVDNGAGTTYISKIPTPAGTPLTNTTYWMVYGASSGAILNLQTRMDSAETNINSIESEINSLGNAINVKTPPEETGLSGVVGDGVADDTIALDAIMQYALANDMSVFFPEGTYKISTITIRFTSAHKTLNLFGVGNKSVILSSGSGIIFMNTSEQSVPNYCKVENLRFTATSTSGTRLLQYINIFNGLIQNCLFESADIGLVLGSNIWTNVINCRFNSCSWDNVYMCGSAEDNRCLYAGNNAVNFYGCVSYGAGRDGFECIGNSGCNFYGCTSENNAACGIRILKSGSFNGRGNLISGGWFEFNPSGHVYIDGTNAAADCNETVRDCGFIADSDQTTPSVDTVGTNVAVLIEGCHFRRISGTVAALNDSSNVRSVHNRFSYVPTFAEINSEHSDTPHCKVEPDGNVVYKTRDITNVTVQGTGTYRVYLNRWLNSVSVTALNSGRIASAALYNQTDGTCYVTVKCREISGHTDADSDFSFIGM